MTHTVGTIPRSNRKNRLNRGKTDTPNTNIHGRSLS